MDTQIVKETYQIDPEIINIINGTSDANHKKIPIEKLILLRQKKLSYRAIAKLMDCDVANVYNRLKPHLDELEMSTVYRDNKADIFEFNQRKIVKAINDNDIKNASLLQKTTAIGILEDKIRLVRGESTANVSISSIVEMVNKDNMKKQSKDA